MKPKTITDHIRFHLVTGRLFGMDYPSLIKTEWSGRFERLMRNRMIFGAFRYGLLRAFGKKQFDRIKDIRKRLDLYEQTHNMEYLVDSANLLMLELEEGDHPDKHFTSADDEIHTEEI